MNSAQDISWFDLSLGYLLLLIPFYFFYKYKTGLISQPLKKI